MRTRILAIGMLAMVLGAGGAFAQDAKAMEILGKARKAIGGATLEGLKTLSVEASTERNVGQMQMAGEVEMSIEMPDKYVKSETSRGMMNMTMTTGFNGDRAILPANASFAGGGAMIIRMGPGGPTPGDAPKLTDEQKAQLNQASLRSARVELSRLMLGWLGMAHPTLQAKYTYAGEAESPDGKAHVIDVKDTEGFEARLFIDQNNGLPLMVSYKGRAPRMVTSAGPAMVHAAPGGAARGEAPAKPLSEEERKKMQQDAEERVKREMADQPLVEFSMFFDDWRQVDGINFPHVMRRASGGETTEEWTINKVKINPKIDAKKFAIDK